MPAAEEGAPPECPVCYELLKAHSRTLSCGHVFCHDCLAKTLLSGARRGTVTRRSITCPVCRHLTFVWPLNANSLGADDGRLIQVPPPSTDSRPHSVHGREARPGRSVWSCKWLPGAFTRVRAVTPAVTPQIFTISGEGRPMEDGDVVSVVSAVGAVGESLTRSGQSENRLSACGVLSLLLILTSLTVASAVLRCILMGYS